MATQTRPELRKHALGGEHMSEGASQEHEQWAEDLKSARDRRTNTRRAVRLPTKDEIEFKGSSNFLTIRLRRGAPDGGVLGNMQSDGSAFEAWALAFHFWCGVERVEVAWDIPEPDPKHPRGNPHYNRFLYRVDRFCGMFPDWACVSTANQLEWAQSPMSEDSRLELNSPTKSRDVPPSPKAKEATLEFRLSKYGARHEQGRIPLLPPFPALDLDRQLPVGLFLNNKAKGNEVFTAKASAIDLWGVDGDAAWLFELKTARNRKMGIVSELLFYANLIRDMISPEMPTFVFREPTELSRCRRIEACFIGQEPQTGKAGPFHPLLEADLNGRCILGLLNKARQLAGIPVHFRTAVIDKAATQAVLCDTPGRD